MTIDKGIFIKNIFYMLSYAFKELRKNTYEEIASEYFDEIFDLFAEILFRGVSSLLKQGLYRNYVRRDEQLMTLRGKLKINSTIKLYSRGVKRLACVYDEYSENNDFNKILKTTISFLIKHENVKSERKKALRKLLSFFGGVDTIDIHSIKWNSFRLDHNSESYQMLLYLCYFVIDNLLITTDAGSFKMNTFSDEKMCRLFERFVLEYYRKHHPEFNATSKQIAWNVIEEESSMNILPILKTDIFLEIGDRTLIIDTKYYSKSLQSNYDKRTIHSNNQNQILTYVLNHDRNHSGRTDGMLLYAKTQEELQPNGQMKWVDGNIIYYRNLDLSLKFDLIKSQLESLIPNNH